jgi:uncharacterized protein (TIGR02265 family)
VNAPAERLWYQNIVESVFVRGPGPLLTPALRALVKQEGIDLDRLLPAYPVTLVVKVARAALPTMFPGVPAAEAMRSFGAASLRGYNETMLGSAVVGLLKLLGTRRALERLRVSMSAGSNYLKTEFTGLTETSAELTVSDVSTMPEFYQGIFEEGGRLIGAKNFRVTLKPGGGGPGASYHVEWDA